MNFFEKNFFRQNRRAALFGRPIFAAALVLLFAFGQSSLFCEARKKGAAKAASQKPPVVGAARLQKYKALLKNKRIALAANATSVIVGADGTKTRDLDFLLQNGINVTKIFAPEHGFRGDGEAGESIQNDVDKKTGVPIFSLYGNFVKPSPEMLDGIDVVVYDIQDVGARFFTYISTMHCVMEACAENNVPLVIFDRPNPNIDCVAGPIREEAQKSFVAYDPIPLAYGMTAGELAKMINGQGWLEGKAKCDLTVIPVQNYTRKTRYEPPVPPSPNLNTFRAVRFYPFLCLFEATVVSEGRGTNAPFNAVGYPDESFGEYVFTPEDIKGMATNPKFKGKKCYGINFKDKALFPDSEAKNSDGLFTLEYFIQMAKKIGSAKKMVDQEDGLARLWGNKNLVAQIDSGLSEEEIRATWISGVEQFLRDRKPYLIYK